MALNEVECRRCGFRWSVSADKRDRKDLLCKSCRVKPAKVIQYGRLRCEPHTGDFDDDLNPITETGELFLPGERVCGHKDCVKLEHIVAGSD